MRNTRELQAIIEILQRRNVRRIVYFHCDHWEPWRLLQGEAEINEKNAQQVSQFIEEMAKHDHTRRLTLFYSPQIKSTISTSAEGRRATPNDHVVFQEQSARYRQLVLPTMTALAPHEIQVHIHHESFTHTHPVSSDAIDFAPKRKRFMDYLSSAESRAIEHDRFDLAVKVHLETIRAETGRQLDRWFFVHGQWSLQASDPTACNLTNELFVLRNNGCLGDFTMPAGRTSVNPSYSEPHLVLPIDMARGYDHPASMPEPAYDNYEAAAKKFFVWSSVVDHRASSLDTYAGWVRDRLSEPHLLAGEMLSKSVMKNGTLYLKTHAHSLHRQYFTTPDTFAYPLADPSVCALFDGIFTAAARADIIIEFLTAGEIFDEYVGGQRDVVVEQPRVLEG